MVRSSHDSHVLTNHNRAARKRNTYLCTNHATDALLRATEMDQQPSADEHEREPEAQHGVLERLDVPYPEPKYYRPETRPDVVNLRHIPCQTDVQVEHDVYERVVVQIPAVEGEVQHHCQAASAEDGALTEELPADEVDAGEVLFPEGETGEEKGADYDHGDEGGRGVGCAAVGLEGEGQEEEDEGGHEDECADDCDGLV